MIEVDFVGQGDETIVAVHGGPGTDHRLFRPELDRLGSFARVLYFDLPGHGRSPAPRDFRLETVAESLEEVRLRAGLERVTLLGSSYGGFVSLTYALTHPQHVARLILVGTSASSGFRARSIAIARQRGNPAMWAAFQRLWADALSDDDNFSSDWRTLFPLYFAHTTPAIVDAYAARTSYKHSTRRAILPTIKHYDLRADLGGLTMPALVVVGAHDWITPPEEALELAQRLVNSRLVVFESCGHYPFLEEVERFTSLVEAFLSET